MSERRARPIAMPVTSDATDERDAVFPADGLAGSPPPEPLPASVDIERYRRLVGETWHQRGQECTGFALAAIANYLIRDRVDDPDEPPVSRRMLYEMAQVFDGRDFPEGSTLRGAIKGWKRIGVARDDLWPYDPDDEYGTVHGTLTLARVLDARIRPLLRYWRIAGGDVATMQRALAEGRPLFVSARLHVGWYRLYLSGSDAVIQRRDDDAVLGGHAFVIAGYDETGFLLQNSWGRQWGDGGYAVLPYEDWEAHRQDAWVVEADVDRPHEIEVEFPEPVEPDEAAADDAYADMWRHLVVLRDDGQLASTGRYAMDEAAVDTLLYLFQEHTRGWGRRRLAIVADGGYWSTPATVERLRGVRDRYLERGIYPIFLVWETPWFTDLRQELQAWTDRGAGRPMRPDMQSAPTPADRVTAERIATADSAARLVWEQIEQRSRLACVERRGGAALLVEAVAYKRSQFDLDLDVVAHGAGDALLSELVATLPGHLASASLLAPTTTLARFHDTYGPLLASGRLGRLTLVTLDADAEAADVTGSASSSFLDLVSAVLSPADLHLREAVAVEDGSLRWIARPAPLLGLERDAARPGGVAGVAGVSIRTASEVTHTDLAVDENVLSQLVETMLSATSGSSGTGPAETADPLAAASRSRDPLVRAEASVGRVVGRGGRG